MSSDTGWHGNVWQGRKRTLRSIHEILRAKWLIARAPISAWRGEIGFASENAKLSESDRRKAKIWAAHVDRAALRLPVSAKCLPQAIALSRILQTEVISHTVVIAHQANRQSDERDPHMLHAWLELDGTIILGDLPGEWNEILRMPS